MQVLHNWISAGRRVVLQNDTKIRFLFAGALNTVVGLATYPALYILLVELQLHYMVLLLISQTLCVIFAYLTNKYFVFRTADNYIREFAKFASFHVGYLLVNILALPVLVELLQLHPVMAQTMFAVLVITTSYYWHNNITFSKIARK